MTAREKKNILEILKQAIATAPQKWIHLSAVPQVLNAKWGGDPPVPGKGGLKTWLKTEFIGELRVTGRVSREAVFLYGDLRGVILEILLPELTRDGAILQTRVGDILRQNNVPYERYTKEREPKRTMTEWIEEDFRGLLESYFETRNGAAMRMVCLPGTGKGFPSANTVVPSSDVRREIRQVERFAFMDWKLVKRLQKNIAMAVDEQTLRGEVAHRFCRAFLKGQGLLDATGDREPRLCIRLGFETVDGKELYGVFERNPNYEDGAKQYWLLSDFCYPGEEREGSLGKWLEDRFSLDAASQQLEKERRELEEAMKTLENKGLLLRAQAQSLLETVEKGNRPSRELADILSDYEQSWRQMETLTQKAGMTAPEQGWTLPALREEISRSGGERQKLRRIVAEFERLVDWVRKILEKYKLLTDEAAACLDRDIQTIEERYDGERVDSFEGFRMILSFYQAMKSVAEADNAPEVDQQIELVSDHFGIPYRSVMYGLVALAPEDSYSLARVENIQQQIKDFEANAQSALASDAEELTVDALRARVLETQTWVERWHTCLRREESGDPLEEALALGRLDEARRLARKREIEDIPWEKLDENKDCLTFYDAGERIRLAVGNQNRWAERYFLLGLNVDPGPCAERLLTLYCREEEPDAFLAIWKTYGGTLRLQEEVQRYLLSCLEGRDFAGLCGYVGSNIELLYRQDTLELLLSAAERAGDEKRTEEWRDRLTRIKAWPEPTDIEEALIKNDREAIQTLLTDADAEESKLEERGYTGEEKERFLQAARSGEYPEDGNLLGTGSRLYVFQKNKNSLAERYFWKGLGSGDRGACGAQLLLLLAEEGRWSECAALYESMEGTLSKRLESRQIYFCALLFAGPERSEAFLRSNFQDCLAAMNNRAMAGTIRPQAVRLQSSGLAVSEIYRRLLELDEAMQENPLVKSAALQDSSLAALLFNSVELNRMGIPPQRQTAMQELYTSGAYPNGGTASGVAERVQIFLGPEDGACEKFARFALPDPLAAELLQKQYMARGDQKGQKKLLEAYPGLREKYRKEYLHLLFLDERYEELLSQQGQAEEDMGPEAGLEWYTARLKTGESIDAEELPPIDESMDPWFASEGGILVEALTGAGQEETLERIFLPNFDRWLKRMEKEALWKLVSAAEASLPYLQKTALANGPITFAIYCYTHFALAPAEAGELAEEYYQRQLRDIPNLDGERYGERLSVLRKLYGEKTAELERDCLLLTLAQKMKTANTDPTCSGTVTQLLSQAQGNGELPGRLLSLFEGSALCFQEPIYNQLDRICRESGREKEEVEFFHRQSLPRVEEVSALPFANFLIGLYQRALEEERFDPSMLEGAKRFCRFCGTREKSFSAFQTLYGLLGLKGEGIVDAWMGQWLLLYLNAAGLERSEGQESWLTKTIEEIWPDGTPDQEEFFCHVADACACLEDTEENLGSIFRFLCACREIAVAVDKEEGGALWGEELYRLYLSPRYGKNWSDCKELMHNCTPEGEARFLANGARFDGHMPEDCVKHCLQYGYTEFLRFALSWWMRDGVFVWKAGEEDSEKGSVKCFALDGLLYSLLEHGEPEFFRIAPGETWQEELLSAYCRQMGFEKFQEKRNAVHFAALIGTQAAVEQVQGILEGDQNMKSALYFDLLWAGHPKLAKENAGILVSASGKFHDLIGKLEALSEEELAAWSETPVNVKFLQTICPDANFPTEETLNALAVNSLRFGTEDDGIILMERFLDANPGDRTAGYSLYVLSARMWAEDPDRYFPLLHKSLKQLSAIPVREKQKPFYLIQQEEFAVLLGGLNAVLTARRLTDRIGDENYIFSDTLLNMPESARLTETWRDGIQKSEQNIRERLGDRGEGEPEQSPESQLCMAAITGEWLPLLRESWQRHSNLRSLLSWDPFAGTDVFCHKNPGRFVRGLLRLILPMDRTEREECLAWLRDQLKVPGDASRKEKGALLGALYPSFRFVESILPDEDPACHIDPTDPPEWLDQMVRCATEHPAYFETTQRIFFPQSRENGPDLAERICLYGGLSGGDGALKEIRTLADQAFKSQKFAAAHAYYLALLKLYKSDLKLIGPIYTAGGRQMVDRSKPIALSLYETELKCRLKLCLHLGGQTDAGELTVGELVNSVLLLSNTWVVGNTEEFLDRLAETLTSREQKTLLSILRTCLLSNATDEQKYDLLDELCPYAEIENYPPKAEIWNGWGVQARLHVTYLLKYPYGKYEGTQYSVFLHREENAKKLNEEYTAMMKNWQGRKSFPTVFLIANHPLFSTKTQMKPAEQEIPAQPAKADMAADDRQPAAPKDRAFSWEKLRLPEPMVLPRLAEKEAGEPWSDPNGAHEVTQEALDGLRPSRNTCRERTHLSALLYCQSAVNGSGDEGLLYQYGICLYYEKNLEKFRGFADEAKRDLCRDLLILYMWLECYPKLELLNGVHSQSRTYFRVRIRQDLPQKLKLLIDQNAWVHTFISSFESLEALMKDYTDPALSDFYMGLWQIGKSGKGNSRPYEKIHKALESLRDYEITEKFESGILRTARDKLSQRSNLERDVTVDYVRGLVENAQYQLNNRAELELTILNSDISPTISDGKKGYIFGQVECEKGAASDLRLYLKTADWQSPLYTLERLTKKAAFCVECISDFSQEALAIELFLTYRDDITGEEKKISRATCLPVCASDVSSYSDLKLLEDKTITDFTVENGQVRHNKDFYGRKMEKSRLENLVRGSDFSDYTNACLYGLRRSGKTSLLYYLEAYIDATCGDRALCCIVDVQGVVSGNMVYSAFVTEVLYNLDSKRKRDPLYAGLGGEQWETWKSKWERLENEEDVFGELDAFYRELYDITGKRLVLLLDEVDRFFDNITSDQTRQIRLESLMNWLAARTNGRDPYFKLVICGSVSLLYGKTAQDHSQFFQKISSKIRVGQLEYKDCRDMIAAACEEREDIFFPQATLDWLLACTNGMALQTKLLANEAVERAHELGRKIVYPSDILERRDKVINEKNCLQFRDEIPEGSGADRVLNVMQSLAGQEDTIVSMEAIQERAGLDADELSAALQLLEEKLQLVKSEGKKGYYFTLGIYWRYFRSYYKRKNGAAYAPEEAEAPSVFTAPDFD